MDEYSLARAYDAGFHDGKKDAYWRGITIGSALTFFGMMFAAILAVL